MKTIHLDKLLLIFILAAGIVRFWKIPELGYFMMDEERDMFLVKRIVEEHKPLLIGVSIPGWFYLAPGYYYLSAIVHILFKLNPIGGLIAAAAIGVILVGLQYLVGKKTFGSRVGLIAGCLSAFSYLFVIYNRIWWPLVFGPIVSLIIYWSIFELKNNFNFKWILILTAVVILGLHSDSGTLAIIPVIVFSWWYFKFPIKDKRVLLGILMVFLSHITLLIFDLRHDFLNTKAFFNIFINLSGSHDADFLSGMGTAVRQLGSTFWRMLFISGPLDVVKQISPHSIWVNAREIPVWKSILSFGLLGIFVIKNRKRFLSWHLVSAFLGISLYATLYQGYTHEWFLEPVFPAIILGWAWLINKFIKANSVLCFGLIIWSIFQITLLARTNNVAGLGTKLRVVQEAQAQISGRPYELRSEGDDSLRYGGWRYLFTLFGNPPVKSYMDYVYEGWLYQKILEQPEVLITVFNNENKSDFALELF